MNSNADFLGKAAIELNSFGAASFRINYVGAKLYTLSQSEWQRLAREIMVRNGGQSLINKYIIESLIQVNSLEYCLYDQSGQKIDIDSKGDIERIAKAKLGVQWSANDKKNLAITEPRFIGYRVFRIHPKGIERVKPLEIAVINKLGAGVTTNPATSGPDLDFEEVSRGSLRLIR